MALVREQLRLGINPDCPHSQWSHYKDVDGKKVRTRTAAVRGALDSRPAAPPPRDVGSEEAPWRVVVPIARIARACGAGLKD